MDQVDTGKDKIKQICEVLRKETLEPAIHEAKIIVEEAQKRAQQILAEAKQKSEELLQQTEREIEKKQEIFKASLNQGARQALEWLRQEIEERFLHRNLAAILAKTTNHPKILSEMIFSVLKAMEKEGLDVDLTVFIPSVVQPREINELLGKEVLEKLKEKSVLIGSQKGGIEVKLHGENITLDLTDAALVELITRYIRKDFQQYFFTKK